MVSPVPDPVYVFREEEEIFHSVLFLKTEHGEYLATGTGSGKVSIWDLTTNRTTKHSLTTGELSCLSLCFIENILVTQNKEGIATFWSLTDHQERKRLGEIEMNYTGFCQISTGIFNDRAVVICPEERAGLRVYSVASRKKISSLIPEGDRTKYGEVMACRIVHTHVLAVYENGELLVWDLCSGKIVSSLKLTEDTPMTLDFDVMRSLGVLGSSGNKLIVFKLDAEHKASVRHAFSIKSEGVSAVRFRPDGKVFAVGSWDGKVRIFAAKTCRQLAVLDFHDVAILDVTFSKWPISAYNDRTLMAVSAKDGKVSMWDIC